MNRKVIAVIAVAVVAVALVATGLVIIMGHQIASPAGNQNPSPEASSSQISLDQATTAVQNYLGKMGYSDLSIGTVQEYSNMYYVPILEHSNDTGAFELSVNKDTGAVTPMQGPTMTWNTKYGVSGTGMMGGKGMMTWIRGTPTTSMAVNMEQAKTLAQQYLDANYTGSTVGQVTTYYGYYTMQVMKDGNIVGMMAVYGDTGQIMYYNWMGTYMQATSTTH